MISLVIFVETLMKFNPQPEFLAPSTDPSSQLGLPLSGLIPQPRHYEPVMPEQLTVLGEKPAWIGGVRRLVQTATFTDFDGLIQEFRIIDRIPKAKGTTDIVMFPGCTEIITGGSFKNFTDAVAVLNPGSRVAAIASDGLNSHGTRLTAQGYFDRSFAMSGAARARSTAAFANGRSVKCVKESMDGAVGMHMLKYNTDTPVVDIEATVFHSDGCVTPDRVKAAMLVGFLPLLSVDLLSTMAKHPLQAVHNLALRTDLLHPNSLEAIAAQAIHLLAGTPYALMDEVAEYNVQGYVKGTRDALCQRPVLKRLKKDHPNTVDVKLLRGGHAAEYDYLGSARQVQAAFGRLACLPGPLRH